MTLEELTSDIDVLEKMSDAELLEHFRPMLCVTRPELANPSGEKKRFNQPTFSYDKSSQYKQAQALAASFGIKI